MSPRRRQPRIAAPTVSYTIDPTLKIVILAVTIPAGTTSLSVSRTGPSGVSAGVRGYSPLTISGQTLVNVRDLEAPLGVTLTYTVTVSDASSSSATTLTVFVAAGGCSDTWLTDLARSTNTQKVIIEALDELAYEAPTGVHWIIDRRTPIVSGDVAHTPTFELDLLTETDDQRERARAALGNGIPVLLRTPPDQGIGNLYLSVLDWKEQRILKQGSAQDRRFAVSAVQVDRPDPGLYVPTGVATYASVRSSYATYAALNAARASYDAVLWDYTGAEAVDIVAWPPADV